MPARLILNADDFGLTPGINRAIAELHHAGALTSATLMATGPAFDDALRIAHGLPPLGVGCPRRPSQLHPPPPRSRPQAPPPHPPRLPPRPPPRSDPRVRHRTRGPRP